MRGLLSVVLMSSLVLPTAVAATGGLEVVANGNQVSVRAERVPLNRILDRLAQQTGMKVTYESTPPSQPVTATLERLPPRDAIVRLMEGLGVSYVFRTDVSGERVETLFVSDSSSGARSASSSSAQEGMEYQAEVIEDVAEYEEPVPELSQPTPGGLPEPQLAPGMPAPDLALPNMGAGPGFPTANPPFPTFPGPVSNPFPR
jgi:hypothetical protein